MENKDKPAFPAEAKLQGLTKRELIAAMAMQGLVGSDRTRGWQSEQVAQGAVIYADLLLKELEK
jgi:hypothetical protein